MKCKMVLLSNIIAPLIMASLVPGWAIVSSNQDDSHQALPGKQPYKDQRCVLVGDPNDQEPDRISWGCTNSGTGCSGPCYEGIYAQRYHVCKPHPGSVCAAEKGKVRVIKKPMKAYVLATVPANHFDQFRMK